jgi:hypothetical protein
MYICQCCDAQISLGERSFLKVTETRHKSYPPKPLDKKKGKKGQKADRGGEGVEIVSEIRVCKNCR